jgi:hypothetical protein
MKDIAFLSAEAAGEFVGAVVGSPVGDVAPTVVAPAGDPMDRRGRRFVVLLEGVFEYFQTPRKENISFPTFPKCLSVFSSKTINPSNLGKSVNN